MYEFDIQGVVDFVKAKRSATLTYGEKLDIILLYAKLKQENIEKKNKIGKGRKSLCIDVHLRVASLLNRKAELVSKVWKEYIENQIVSLASAVHRPDRCSDLSGIAVLVDVRHFIRERRETRVRTTAKDVMIFLKDSGRLDFDESSYSGSLRKVQRYLKRNGYQRGNRPGKASLKLRNNLKLQRDIYVNKMICNSESRFVYLDESYIHCNYSRHEDSLYDPNDQDCIEPIKKHKGQRYCFIGAIISGEPSIPEELQFDSDAAHFITESLDIFVGGRTKDYHGMFDGEYFKKWISNLIRILSEKDISKAIVIMDNAKYHKQLPPDTPKSSNTKKLLLEYCERKGIVTNATSYKSMIWADVIRYINDNVKPIVVKMLEDAGHQVIFTPPYHSDLQPIELIWANVKGEVGRQYDNNTNFSKVLERLKSAFANLTSKCVKGCIDKTNKILHSIHKEINFNGESSEGESSEELSSTL